MCRVLLAGAVAVSLIIPIFAQSPSFDRLSDAHRQALQQRFEKDVWPLLIRGGKDGCVGCHNGKGGASLRLRGDVAKDFAFLVKEGFFIPKDPGSLLGRITDKDKKRHMPPAPRPSWTDAEIQILRDFEADLERKQSK